MVRWCAEQVVFPHSFRQVHRHHVCGLTIAVQLSSLRTHACEPCCCHGAQQTDVAATTSIAGVDSWREEERLSS